MNCELDIPEEASRQNTIQPTIVVEMPDGETVRIGKDDVVQFEQFEGAEYRLEGFMEIHSDNAQTFAYFHCDDGKCSDIGISGFDIYWTEVAERIRAGTATKV